MHENKSILKQKTNNEQNLQESGTKIFICTRSSERTTCIYKECEGKNTIDQKD